MAGSVSAAVDAVGGRVTLTVTGLVAASVVTVTRSSSRPHSSNAAATPYESSQVRGWAGTTVAATQATVHDYEYDPSDGSTWWYTVYRVTATDGTDVQVTVRPQQVDWWIKSVQNPSRNLKLRSPRSPDLRKVGRQATTRLTLENLGGLKRASRTGRFPIVGSPYPVMVTDVHTALELTCTAWAEDVATLARLETLVCNGDVLFLQAPTGLDAPGPLWAVAGDWQPERLSGASTVHRVSFPLTRCAAPSPLVIGSAWTYATTRSAYPGYAALKAAWPTGYAAYVAGPPPGEIAAS